MMRSFFFTAFLVAIAFFSNAQSGLKQDNRFNPDRDNQNIFRSRQQTNDRVEYTEAESNYHPTPRKFTAPICLPLKSISEYPLFVDASLQSKVQSMLYSQQLQYSSKRILTAVNSKSLFATKNCKCIL